MADHVRKLAEMLLAQDGYGAGADSARRRALAAIRRHDEDDAERWSQVAKTIEEIEEKHDERNG
jgi:hypothetical protein